MWRWALPAPMYYVESEPLLSSECGRVCDRVGGDGVGCLGLGLTSIRMMMKITNAVRVT